MTLEAPHWQVTSKMQQSVAVTGWLLPVVQLCGNGLWNSCVRLCGQQGVDTMQNHWGTTRSDRHGIHRQAGGRQRSRHHGYNSILVIMHRLLLHSCQLWHKSEHSWDSLYARMLSDLYSMPLGQNTQVKQILSLTLWVLWARILTGDLIPFRVTGEKSRPEL
jgi:hypothetical protein